MAGGKPVGYLQARSRGWARAGTTEKQIHLVVRAELELGTSRRTVNVIHWPLRASRGWRDGGMGGGPCSLVPNNIFLVFPCSLKVFLRCRCSMFPKICFCSRVPSFIFLLFPCSLKVNGHVRFFPKAPGRPSSTRPCCLRRLWTHILWIFNL